MSYPNVIQDISALTSKHDSEISNLQTIKANKTDLNSYLKLSGGNTTGTITSNLETVTWYNGNTGKSIINSNVSKGQYTTLWRYPSTNGVFTLSGWQGSIYLNYTSDAIIADGTNTTSHKIQLLNEDGTTFHNHYITASARNNSGGWYRKWSNGWIEQGGNFTNSARQTTINFFIPFTQNTYQAFACIQHGAPAWTATTTACIVYNSRTTTSMVVQIYHNTSNTTGLNSWYVCGI